VSNLDQEGYLAFLQSKFRFGADFGHKVAVEAVHPFLKPHQREMMVPDLFAMEKVA